MYPGLPGKEGAPPPPASYPPPQVFLVFIWNRWCHMISHANIFLIASVIDESLSPAATGSSPGGDSGEVTGKQYQWQVATLFHRFSMWQLLALDTGQSPWTAPTARSVENCKSKLPLTNQWVFAPEKSGLLSVYSGPKWGLEWHEKSSDVKRNRKREKMREKMRE